MNPIEVIQRKAALCIDVAPYGHHRQAAFHEALDVLKSGDVKVYIVTDGKGDIFITTFTRRVALQFIQGKSDSADKHHTVVSGKFYTYLAPDLTEFSMFRSHDDSLVSTYRVIERAVRV